MVQVSGRILTLGDNIVGKLDSRGEGLGNVVENQIICVYIHDHTCMYIHDHDQVNCLIFISHTLACVPPYK